MWYIYTVEYSAIKNNEFMTFLGKWMDLEDINLSEVTQSQKTHIICIHWSVDISPESPNTQDNIRKTHEIQEGRPQCGYFDPS
jgi:hypothetical protein